MNSNRYRTDIELKLKLKKLFLKNNFKMDNWVKILLLIFACILLLHGFNNYIVYSIIFIIAWSIGVSNNYDS